MALLRGINVGGSKMLSMAELKTAFEGAGMNDVSTYINSGNVIFTTDRADRTRLITTLERAIRALGVEADVQLRSADEIGAVIDALPESWQNGPAMKCDVVFLQPEVDSPAILDELGPRPGIEDALYVPGAVIWRVDRENATRNRLTRIVGTPLYSRVTVRNCNTTRKLLDLLSR